MHLLFSTETANGRNYFLRKLALLIKRALCFNNDLPLMVQAVKTGSVYTKRYLDQDIWIREPYLILIYKQSGANVMTVMSPAGKSDHLPPDGARKNGLVLWVLLFSPVLPSQVRGVLILECLKRPLTQ